MRTITVLAITNVIAFGVFYIVEAAVNHRELNFWLGCVSVGCWVFVLATLFIK